MEVTLMMGQNMMSGGMGFWMIFNVIFWLLIVVGIGFLLFWGVNKTKEVEKKPKEESALDILKNRYAGGEINREEFEEKKKDLL
jgi:putative membrane protein